MANAIQSLRQLVSPVYLVCLMHPILGLRVRRLQRWSSCGNIRATKAVEYEWLSVMHLCKIMEQVVSCACMQVYAVCMYLCICVCVHVYVQTSVGACVCA